MGKPSAIIATYQLPGSNAVDAATGVRNLMAKMKQQFPQDMDYSVALDQTRSVTEGIKEIVKTLLIALALVIFVVYIFLQGWRATLIPLLAVPVSLVGTFVMFPVFGFSVNTLSLFGLVLAIGLVVDDAIVVVEGVERHIEEGMTPKDAAVESNGGAVRPRCWHRTGSVCGVRTHSLHPRHHGAALPAVRSDHRDFGSSLGVQCPHSQPGTCGFAAAPKKPSNGLLRRFFDWFNRVFGRATEGYVSLCGGLIRKSGVAVVMLVAFSVAAGFFGSRVPSSFLPDEDQGYLFVNMQLPNASSLQRTDTATRGVEKILASTPGVQFSTSVIGFSLLSYVRTSYNAFFFVTLKPWDERTTKAEQFQEIKARLNRELSRLPEGDGFQFLATRDSRRGHIGRIHVCPGRPGRQRCAVSGEQLEHIPDSCS